MTNFHADQIEIDGLSALVRTPVVRGAGPQLRAALELRRQATLTGRCGCGAIRPRLGRATRRTARLVRAQWHGRVADERDIIRGVDPRVWYVGTRGSAVMLLADLTGVTGMDIDTLLDVDLDVLLNMEADRGAG